MYGTTSRYNPFKPVTKLVQLIYDLTTTRNETLKYFDLGEEDLERTYGPGKWSVRFLLHHLADSETVENDRIRRILSEPRQVLPVSEQDDWARGLDYQQLPLDISRRIYESVRTGIIYLADLHYEKHGHLEFVHSVDGVRTLKQEFEKVAAHNAKHLEHIRIALSRRHSQ